MGTSKGVIQGFCGVGAVDSAHQVVVEAEAFGQGPENDLLEPILEGLKSSYQFLGDPKRLMHQKVSADSGFYSSATVAYVFKEGLDAYLPDSSFRKRDVRFSTVEKYKRRSRKERQRRTKTKAQVEYTSDQFQYDKERNKAICPAGEALYASGIVTTKEGLETRRFKGAKGSCVPCTHRDRCLQKPNITQIRQVSIFKSLTRENNPRAIDRMQEKIDTESGRHKYSRRMGIVEPVFGHEAKRRLW